MLTKEELELFNETKRKCGNIKQWKNLMVRRLCQVLHNQNVDKVYELCKQYGVNTIPEVVRAKD
jgi:hypothetical protein